MNGDGIAKSLLIKAREYKKAYLKWDKTKDEDDFYEVENTEHDLLNYILDYVEERED